ncbi:DUF5325 family protein [Brevibacillus daliensis]|uniref:DUF5325 family protein n=1 Tax=Brevibacillus daliensis TaxID=2892995 RepID=UPI0035A003D2
MDRRYKLVTLVIATLVAFSLMGIGVSIGEGSTLGVIGCIAAAFLLMGFGFSYKKRQTRQKQ